MLSLYSTYQYHSATTLCSACSLLFSTLLSRHETLRHISNACQVISATELYDSTAFPSLSIPTPKRIVALHFQRWTHLFYAIAVSTQPFAFSAHVNALPYHFQSIQIQDLSQLCRHYSTPCRYYATPLRCNTILTESSHFLSSSRHYTAIPQLNYVLHRRCRTTLCDSGTLPSRAMQIRFVSKQCYAAPSRNETTPLLSQTIPTRFKTKPLLC